VCHPIHNTSDQTKKDSPSLQAFKQKKKKTKNMFKRTPTVTTTTRHDAPSRSQSTTSTAVPPSLFSNDGASILTELPTYADVYAHGRVPAIGLATNFAFPRPTNMSMVQDWSRSNVDWDLFFYQTTNMVLRMEGRVYTLRHQVGMCVRACVVVVGGGWWLMCDVMCYAAIWRAEW